MNLDDLKAYFDDKYGEYDEYKYIFYVRYRKRKYSIRHCDADEIIFDEKIYKIYVDCGDGEYLVWSSKKGWSDLTPYLFEQSINGFKDYYEVSRKIKRRRTGGVSHHGRTYDPDEDVDPYYFEGEFIKYSQSNMNRESIVDVLYAGNDLSKVFKIV